MATCPLCARENVDLVPKLLIFKFHAHPETRETCSASWQDPARISNSARRMERQGGKGKLAFHEILERYNLNVKMEVDDE